MKPATGKHSIGQWRKIPIQIRIIITSDVLVRLNTRAPAHTQNSIESNFSFSNNFFFDENKIEWRTFRVIIRLKMCCCRHADHDEKRSILFLCDSHLPIHVFTFNFAIFLFIACRLSFCRSWVPAALEVWQCGCCWLLRKFDWLCVALTAATATLCSRTVIIIVLYLVQCTI